MAPVQFLRQELSPVERWIGGLIACGLLLLTCVSFAWRNAAMAREGGGNFQHADWLVNYADGIVRRGLSGEALLAISDVAGVSPVWIAVIIQTGGLWLLVAACIYIAWKLGFSPRLTLLLASPAFILAWHNEFETHGKEIIAYLAFLPLLIAILAGRGRGGALLISAAVFGLAAFLHEAMIFLAPGLLLCGWMLCDRDLRQPAFQRFFVAVGVICLAVILFTLTFSRIDDHGIMCDRVMSYGGVSDTACGMFVWFTETASHASTFTIEAIERRSPERFVLALAAAYLTPAIIFWAVRPYWRVIVCFAAGFLIFLPLYVVAIDYGRWLNMQISVIVFVVIAALASQTFVGLQKPMSRMVFWPLLGSSLLWRVSLVSGGIGAGLLKPVVLWVLKYV